MAEPAPSARERKEQRRRDDHPFFIDGEYGQRVLPEQEEGEDGEDG
jgi:hypothetical protein